MDIGNNGNPHIAKKIVGPLTFTIARIYCSYIISLPCVHLSDKPHFVPFDFPPNFQILDFIEKKYGRNGKSLALQLQPQLIFFLRHDGNSV